MTMSNPRQEAEERLGGRYEVHVLEPSPPALDGNLDDPAARGDVPAGRELVSPASDGDLTWDELARGDAELADWCAARWLGAWKPLRPLPAPFAETRLALHRVGELVASPARRAGTGDEISLRYTRGGFGTPFYGDDMQVRVEETELIVVVGHGERRVEIESVKQAAGFVGTITSADLDAAPLAIDGEAATVLGEWYGFATLVLAELRARAGEGLDPSAINLWAEHFDVAVELGSEKGGQRAAYGGSPGDEDHPDPYLYVGPWAEVPRGDLWNATHFGGALLPYDRLLASDDQVALALDFFEHCVGELTSR